VHQGTAISVTRELRGMPVLRHDSEEEIGVVQDLVLHPTSGWVVALLVRQRDGSRRVVMADDWFIDGEAVMARPGSALAGTMVRHVLAEGVAATRALLGLRILSDSNNCLGYATDRGEYLGYVRDILVVPGAKRAVYQVGDSRVSTGGFYLAANVPVSYSRPDACIEVARGIAERCAGDSPAEAVDLATTTLGARVLTSMAE
jgi:uncharacterized protein YrrD